MSTNAHFAIDRHFSRATPGFPKIHPMRLAMQAKQQRNPLPISGDERKPRRAGLVRDILISIMGGVSALVPIVIAAQTMLGA
jgi:hypothetical protein